MRGIDPERLVRRALQVADGKLQVGHGAGKVSIGLRKLFVAGAGKAAGGMAAGVTARVPDARGLVLVPPGGRATEPSGIRQKVGNHPTPGRDSLQATEALLAAIARTPAETEILFLLSGGASALLSQPRSGVSAAEKAAFTDRMLRAGAPIGLLNRARLRVSAVKGGRLAQAAFPRRITTLVLSDIPGGAAWEIGSGPTRQPPELIWGEDLRPELKRLLGEVVLPEAVAREMGPRPVPAGRTAVGGWFMVGDNARARQAAARAARRRGHPTRISRYRLQGEASQAAQAVLAQLQAQPKRVSCVVFGGETTVSMTKAGGLGGRSQELALAAVPGLSAGGWVLLAAGTDGVDGVGGATGALVGPGTLDLLGASAVEEGLHGHDSATVLGRAGALLVTGPTGTNVGDLVIALRIPLAEQCL